MSSDAANDLGVSLKAPNDRANLDANVCLRLTASSLIFEEIHKWDASVRDALLRDSSASATTSGDREIALHDILHAELQQEALVLSLVKRTSKRVVRPRVLAFKLAGARQSQASDLEVWVERLNAAAYPQSGAVRRFKVLVNPHGGKGRAERIWSEEAAPVFSAARCHVDVTVTTHKRHAEEIAQNIALDSFDAIICCSGDGTPHEVFNGLAKHADAGRALSQMAVGQVPGGSGNALSLNMNGTNSPSLAALAIVKSVKVPFDLMAITQGESLYYSFLSQSVGIVAEVDLGTEGMRWIGDSRVVIGFFLRLAGKMVYPAVVSVKVEQGDKQVIRAEYVERARASLVDSSQARSGIPLRTPRYGTVRDAVPSDWLTSDLKALGNFYCGNMAWMSADLPFFPAALSNDGLADLITVNGDISRLRSVKLLLAVENNDFFDQPEVQYRKITAYRITPRLRPDQKEGFISIDGERVPFEPFQAEVMPGLATILAQPGKGYHQSGPKHAQSL